MKYIDLDNGIYTDPCTGEVCSCRIAKSYSVYYLHVENGLCHPFRMVGLKDYVDIKMFCRNHGLKPVADYVHPCFSTSDEIKQLADILNDEINFRGELFGEKFVGTNDDVFDNEIKLEFE